MGDDDLEGGPFRPQDQPHRRRQREALGAVRDRRRSQVWGGDVATYGAADIRLEPVVLAEAEKPAPPPGGVLVTRQGDARRVQTDLYEAVVDGDGCVPSLRVDGVEFFKPGVNISRGAYFHQGGTQQLPDVVQSGPAILAAREECRDGPHLRPGQADLGAGKPRPTPPMAFYIVFDPAVIAVRNAKDELAQDSRGDNKAPPDPKWAKTTWYAGRAQIDDHRAAPKSGARGPTEGYQVWEATLAPKEKRTVVLETGLTLPTRPNRRRPPPGRQAADDRGGRPCTRPLDYQVVQRKTRPQRRRPDCAAGCRSDFDRLEARVWARRWTTPRRASGRGCRRRPGCIRSTLTMPAPAGGWYRLEVRALKDGKEIGSAVVDHVGVGEVFVGAGQSNSTNCGQFQTQPQSGLVSTFGGTDWRLADDPQPGVHDGSRAAASGRPSATT